MIGALSCKEFVEFLDDYLAGALDEGRRAEFNAHLGICVSCVAFMKTYQAAVKLGKAAFQPTSEPVPASVPEELVRAILAARRKP